MDKDGYPTPEELEKIKDWKPSDSKLYKKEAKEFFQWIIDACWWPDSEYTQWTETEEGDLLSMSTVGWSGNEEIISVMQANWYLWNYWNSHTRGGHYTFVFSKD